MLVMPAAMNDVKNDCRFSMQMEANNEIMQHLSAGNRVNMWDKAGTTTSFTFASWWRSEQDDSESANNYLFRWRHGLAGTQNIGYFEVILKQNLGDTHGLSVYVYNRAGTLMKSIVNSNGSTTNNVWYHLAVTYDNNLKSVFTPANNGRFLVYLNGVRYDDAAVSRADADWVAPGNTGYDTISVGARTTGAQQTYCSVYDIATWGVALRPEEIKKIYNNGKPLDYRVNQNAYSSAAALHYFWRFDKTGNTVDQSDSLGRDVLLRATRLTDGLPVDLLQLAGNISDADRNPEYPGQ